MEIPEGHKVGRLTYVAEAPTRVSPSGRRRRVVLLRCDCGTELVREPRPWLTGKALSCGCLRNELHADRLRTHGQRNTPLYETWASMKQRSTPGSAASKHGRYDGVGRDKRWDTFEGFLLNPPKGTYGPGVQLSRTGDTGDYTPDNTRWASATENRDEMLDRRKLRLPDGRFACEVAREKGIPTSTWEHRYYSQGVDLETAVSVPNLRHHRPAS